MRAAWQGAFLGSQVRAGLERGAGIEEREMGADGRPGRTEILVSTPGKNGKGGLVGTKPNTTIRKNVESESLRKRQTDRSRDVRAMCLPGSVGTGTPGAQNLACVYDCAEEKESPDLRRTKTEFGVCETQCEVRHAGLRLRAGRPRLVLPVPGYIRWLR